MVEFDHNKNLLQAILRNNFESFVEKVFSEVSAGDNYKQNWHISLVCDRVMNMIEGNNNRLIVNIPPRYLKSIIVSVALPAYLLGHNPETNIICVSYSDDLASKHANDCRNVIQSAWYQDLFPGTRLSGSRKSISDFETTKGGGRFSTSVNGTLTGRGADWIIIDDPIKPQDAISDTLRDKANDWYRSTLYSRLNDKANGKIMLIMQRLHEDDMTGFLLKIDPKFELIKLPIIAEQDEKWEITNRIMQEKTILTRDKDELLHPQRENWDVIKSLRESMGEIAFAGQYQQNPVPLQGGIIKKSWINHYTGALPALRYIVQSWDTGNKINDNNAFSACITFGLDYNNKMYILSALKGRWEFPDLVKKVVEQHNLVKAKHRSENYAVLIEDKASGTQLIQTLQHEHNIDALPFSSGLDKSQRLAAASVYIENKRCLFPSNFGQNIQSFYNELLTFPKCTFKDQCDAFSQGVLYIIGEIPVIPPKRTEYNGISLPPKKREPHPSRDPRSGGCYSRPNWIR